MEIFYVQPIMSDKKLHYWYGGCVAKIQHKGFTFIIEAIGDVKATLLDKKGEELCTVKDKSNQGRFDSEMSHFIKTDQELLDLEEKGRLIFDNNNWWECVVLDSKGKLHDMMWVLDSMHIEDAVEEVKGAVEEVIARFPTDGIDINKLLRAIEKAYGMEDGELDCFVNEIGGEK
jgi:hypothetical protein